MGSYDVAIVKENTLGKLNGWLEENGYQPLEDAEDVLKFYRDKGYVYACIRVSDAALRAAARTIVVDLSHARDATTSAFARLVLLRRYLLRTGRDLRLTGLSDRAARLYEVSRLHRVLPAWQRQLA